MQRLCFIYINVCVCVDIFFPLLFCNYYFVWYIRAVFFPALFLVRKATGGQLTRRRVLMHAGFLLFFSTEYNSISILLGCRLAAEWAPRALERVAEWIRHTQNN